MNVDEEVAVLERTSTIDLRKQFAQLCGYSTANRNRTWLIRRIAWRLQANAEGGLSERARARAAELANEAELRATAPHARVVRQDAQESPPLAPLATTSDRRLPVPGGVIVRDYKGRRLEVKVLDQGLEFEGQIFRSLSAVAKHITGHHCSGYLFFRLPGGVP